MRFIQGVNRDYPVRRQPNNRVQTLIVEVDAMPSPTEITVAQLSRIIGLPDAPLLIDVRAEEEFRADPRVIPTARRHDYREKSGWAKHYLHQSVIVYCQRGLTLSQGTAAWLRDQHIHAQTLMGGYLDWISSHQPLVCSERTPARDELGRTVWVTRARPKVVRIACPWLIRRFIDPKAVFLFVAPSEVTGVADRFGATPFDVDGVFWSDRGDKCTFDVMIEEFGLKSQPLKHLARIVRGADTDRLDLTRQSGGLLAASLGFSRMYRDDLAQLEAAMGLYDAYYRWCRDATNETHN
jgi:rhodanese-related sulfurtransferase